MKWLTSWTFPVILLSIECHRAMLMMSQHWFQQMLWRIYWFQWWLCAVCSVLLLSAKFQQATGLDAWASRVKCPARFVSHLHDICIYIWVVYSFCLFCWLFIIVTTQFVALYKPCKPPPPPAQQRYLDRTEPKQQICHQHANTDHFGK